MSRTNDAPVQDEKREQQRREEPGKEANKIKQDHEQESRNEPEKRKRKEKHLPPCRRSDIGLLAETQRSDQGGSGLWTEDRRRPILFGADIFRDFLSVPYLMLLDSFQLG